MRVGESFGGPMGELKTIEHADSALATSENVFDIAPSDLKEEQKEQIRQYIDSTQEFSVFSVPMIIIALAILCKRLAKSSC